MPSYRSSSEFSVNFTKREKELYFSSERMKRHFESLMWLSWLILLANLFSSACHFLYYMFFFLAVCEACSIVSLAPRQEIRQHCAANVRKISTIFLCKDYDFFSHTSICEVSYQFPITVFNFLFIRVHIFRYKKKYLC